MKFVENELFCILQLDKHEEWGENILIIAKTTESIDDIDNLNSLLKGASFQSTHDDVIVDLTLINGFTASNRYVLVGYEDYRLEISRSQTLHQAVKDKITIEEYKESFVKYLRMVTCEYLRKHTELLENSLLPNAHKYIIANSTEVI